MNFLSASSLQKGDASTSTGCLRAWWYQYIGGFKEPQSKAMLDGIELHEGIELYLKTGSRAKLTALALAGMHMVPEPGPDLLVEHSLVPCNDAGVEDLSLAPIRIVDTPILGKIDLMHARGINVGADSVENIHDPEGTVEVIDWKSTSNISNAKAGHELVDTIQMSLYGKYVFAVAPDTKLVRLSHGVFPKRGAPQKVSALVDQEAIERSWKHTHAVGVSIRDAAREANPDLVDANLRACRAYGRDCPAMSVCRAVQHNSLSSLVGSAANRILPRKLPVVQDHAMTAPVATNNLFAKLAAAKNGQATPAPAPITTPPPAAAPAPAQVPAPVADAAVQAEIDRLTNIEAAVHGEAPVVETTPAPTQAKEKHPLTALLDEINSYGFGIPGFSGAAAVAIAAAQGHTITPGAGLAGGGQLGAHTIDDVAALPTILAGVKELAALPKKDEPAFLPETAKIEAPAAKAVELKKDGTPKKKSGRPAKKAEQAEHATETVQTAPATTTEPVNVTINVASVDPEAVAKTIGENLTLAFDTTKTLAEAGAQVTVNVTNLAEKTDDLPPPGPTPQPPGAINVFIDTVCDGVPNLKSLWPTVEFLLGNMNADAAPSADNITDFRCADPNGRYGFGKWRGILAAGLRACPAEGYMPPGNYHLDGAMGEIGGVVAETMRQIARATGGFYVKGAR